jgi:hypothetical protein
MTLAQLRATLAAALAAAAITSCAPHRGRPRDTFVAGRSLGESTASPGSDPDRPIARSLDTQEVSTTISRAPAAPVSTAPAPPPQQLPRQQPPAAPAAPPAAPPPPPRPPAGTGSPGVFAPPPPPPPS